MATVDLPEDAYARAKQDAGAAGLPVQDWLTKLIFDQTKSDFPFDDCGFPTTATATAGNQEAR